MKRIIVFQFFISAIFVSQPLHADSGWTDYQKIGELVPTNFHYYYFSLPVKENPGGCQDDSTFYQNYGLPGSDKIYQTLLEAVKSELQIRVFVTGVCNIHGYAEISSVSIRP